MREVSADYVHKALLKVTDGKVSKWSAARGLRHEWVSRLRTGRLPINRRIAEELNFFTRKKKVEGKGASGDLTFFMDFKGQCSAPACPDKVVGRGYCNKHYLRWLRKKKVSL